MNYLIVLGCLLMPVTCCCQLAGVVTAVHGKATIKGADKTAAVRPGTTVYENETILLSAKGSVTISCAENKPVLINLQNVKGVNKLARMLHADTIPITKAGMAISGALIATCSRAPQSDLLLTVLGSIGREMVGEESDPAPVTGGVHGGVSRGGPCGDTTMQAFDTLRYCRGSLMLQLRKAFKITYTIRGQQYS